MGQADQRPSTPWTLLATFVLGAGLTILICWDNAEWLASAEADESPGSFLTWGMTLAQITAVVLGALVVTTEYPTGMIRSTFAAVPSRGAMLAAKALVGTVTALVGYLGGNYFLDREGIGMALEGDVLRSMYGSGLFVAGIGLFTVAAGFIGRHTAATISVPVPFNNTLLEPWTGFGVFLLEIGALLAVAYVLLAAGTPDVVPRTWLPG